MKQLHQQIPRNRQNLACRRLLVVRNFSFLTEFATKSWKMIPKHCQLKRKQTLTIKVTSCIYKKLLFDFYPTDLLRLKQLSPSESVHSARYIYARYIPPYIPPPLFTTPSGDSCTLIYFVWSEYNSRRRLEKQSGPTRPRLRVVPHFPSGIVERVTHERAWKSSTTREKGHFALCLSHRRVSPSSRGVNSRALVFRSFYLSLQEPQT